MLRRSLSPVDCCIAFTTNYCRHPSADKYDNDDDDDDDDDSGVTRGRGRTAPGDTRRKILLWANLQRKVVKRGRTGKKRCGVTPSRGVTPE